MKKRFLPFFILILAAFTTQNSFSQILLGEHSNVVYGLPSAMEISHYIDVTNASDEEKHIKVKRNVIDQTEGTSNWFCWELCFSFLVNESPDGLILAPGETVDDFIVYFGPAGLESSAIVEYCVFDVNNPEDEVCTTIEFIASNSVGIDDPFAESFGLGEAFPNPANSIVTIPYNLKTGENASLVIYNLLGSEIRSIPLHELQGNQQLKVSDLEAGVYVYALRTATGKLMHSKKMVISH